jgi:hypothetical protein
MRWRKENNRGGPLLGDRCYKQLQDNSADFNYDSDQENQNNLVDLHISNRNYGHI